MGTIATISAANPESIYCSEIVTPPLPPSPRLRRAREALKRGILSTKPALEISVKAFAAAKDHGFPSGGTAATKALTAELKLAPFPTRSPLPFAALPSISLIPSARFTDDTDIQRMTRLGEATARQAKSE